MDGAAVLRRFKRWLTEGGVDSGVAALNRWGLLVVPLSFLFTGTKTVVNAAAGVTRMPYGRYTAAMLVGCVTHATIYATVAGVGMANDAHHVAAPDPEGTGAASAMSAALRDAGLAVSDVGHINAHATSTPAGDVAEAAAIRLTLGSFASAVPVTAPKSCTGHLLGAAGALEAAISCLSLRDRLVPATFNLDDPDDAVELDVVRMSARSLPGGGAALSNSFGVGGHDVALAFTEA